MAADHFCFLDERSRDLYCGDLARLGGTVVVPAGHGGNLAEYLASLRRVRGLNPGRLLPGHGPVVTDPARLIDRYLEHRAKRDAQILDALQTGCTTPEQIVPRIYGSLDPPLDRAAIATVLAHLIKLRDEGTVLDKEGSWSAAAPPRGT